MTKGAKYFPYTSDGRKLPAIPKLTSQYVSTMPSVPRRIVFPRLNEVFSDTSTLCYRCSSTLTFNIQDVTERKRQRSRMTVHFIFRITSAGHFRRCLPWGNYGANTIHCFCLQHSASKEQNLTWGGSVQKLSNTTWLVAHNYKSLAQQPIRNKECVFLVFNTHSERIRYTPKKQRLTVKEWFNTTSVKSLHAHWYFNFLLLNSGHQFNNLS